MTKKQRTHRKPSGIISWLKEKILHRAAPDHESDEEEKQVSKRVPGPVYNLGCSAVAGEIISAELDHGGKYPSSNTDS